MLFTREALSSFKAAQTKTITRIWAADGLCYIPEFGERQKFISRSSNLFEIRKETWDGIIPSAENIETVQYSLITKKPLVWVEKTQWACEKFEETTAHSSM